jgi:HNH endonuclease
MGELYPGLAERFWQHVQRGDGCWLWTGRIGRKGYGVLDAPMPGRKRWRPHTASRLSWEIHFGPIPDGMDVLHHCDTPPCVRPDHLFLGTDVDNRRDQVAKGRHAKRLPRGADGNNAKLTTEQVQHMRAIRAETGRCYASIAAEFGVSDGAAAQAIQGGGGWSELPGAIPRFVSRRRRRWEMATDAR